MSCTHARQLPQIIDTGMFRQLSISFITLSRKLYYCSWDSRYNANTIMAEMTLSLVCFQVQELSPVSGCLLIWNQNLPTVPVSVVEELRHTDKICSLKIKDLIIFLPSLCPLSIYIYLAMYICYIDMFQLVCLQIPEVRFRDATRPMITMTSCCTFKSHIKATGFYPLSNSF